MSKMGVPRLTMRFTNGIPEGLGGQGFDTRIEGSYDKVLALIDEMRKAIVMFKEEDEDKSKAAQASHEVGGKDTDRRATETEKAGEKR